MQTVHASRILAAVGARAGFGREEISGDLFADLRDFLSRRLDEGFEYTNWPELTRWEERWFRAAWDAGTVYAAGDEVFESGSGKYWRALGTTVAGENPSSSSDWEAVTSNFDCYVGYEQAGQTVLGSVFRVTELNPKLYAGESARSLSFWLSDLGVQVTKGINGSLASVWVQFRIRTPELTGAVWDEDASYAAGEQVYFKDSGAVGNFWNCVSDAAAGESPESAAAKWALVELPKFLERFLVAGVYADYLESDGQKEKAISEQGNAAQILEQKAFVLSAQEGQMEPMTVGTR